MTAVLVPGGIVRCQGRDGCDRVATLEMGAARCPSCGDSFTPGAERPTYCRDCAHRGFTCPRCGDPRLLVDLDDILRAVPR